MLSKRKLPRELTIIVDRKEKRPFGRTVLLTLHFPVLYRLKLLCMFLSQKAYPIPGQKGQDIARILHTNQKQKSVTFINTNNQTNNQISYSVYLIYYCGSREDNSSVQNLK